VSIPAGRYRFGPDNGTLSVNTGRTGAVAKAGHDLLLRVTDWEGTLEVGDDTRLEVRVDGGSLKVHEGTGGMQALDDDDKANIEQTIDDEVLEGRGIEFRSRSVEEGSDGKLIVEGDLDLGGVTRPVEFDLVADDGRLSGSARIAQTDWGIKPYSALFGTLKVVDEVDVEIDGRLPA
jgi:polyisoprenoid-binding protein YceI